MNNDEEFSMASALIYEAMDEIPVQAVPGSSGWHLKHVNTHSLGYPECCISVASTHMSHIHTEAHSSFSCFHQTQVYLMLIEQQYDEWISVFMHILGVMRKENINVRSCRNIQWVQFLFEAYNASCIVLIINSTCPLKNGSIQLW